MDGYEAFNLDDYVDFMNKYIRNPVNVVSMASTNTKHDEALLWVLPEGERH